MFQIKQIIKKKYNNYLTQKTKTRISKLIQIDEIHFEKILTDIIGISKGDNVFIHSSIANINLSFPSYNVLKIIRKVIGPEANMLFPTYPKISSYKYLLSNEIFDIKRTPTYTGLLNEYARRDKNAVRSLHPTKSVVGIGPNIDFLLNEHHLSIYPYDFESPYYKITKLNFKVVGLGVKSDFLSAVHAVEDTMKEKYPVNPYHDQIFDAKCIDYQGNTVIVRTLAHDLKKMKFDLPAFFKKFCNNNECKDIKYEGMDFFIADSSKLYNRLVDLALNNVTIYKKKFYRK